MLHNLALHASIITMQDPALYFSLRILQSYMTDYQLGFLFDPLGTFSTGNFTFYFISMLPF